MRQVIRSAATAAALCLGAAGAAEAELLRCETSIRGEALSFLYDPQSPALKDSLSIRERLYGSRGAITCPGLVTLRVMTPELDDSQRAPFCLQWDRKARTYLGYATGKRDAWLSCRAPSRSFCERVNRSRRAAERIGAATADAILGAGVSRVVDPSGAILLSGPGAAIGEGLVSLGSSAVASVGAPAALGAVAATAVVVGGAVYVCSDSGASGAALAPAAPVPGPAEGEAITGEPLSAIPAAP